MTEVRSENRAIEMARETKARLEDRRDDLAELLRFYDPDGDRCEETIDDVIQELSGHVLRAAAIALDGGFKPISRILPDIQRLEGDPHLLMTERGHFDGEAVGEIAAHYQRCDEPVGTWWMDVTEGGADPKNIAEAASRAVETLRALKPGKRAANMALTYLTLALRGVYLRTNDRIHIVPYDSGKGYGAAGRFFRFVSLVGDAWFDLMRELGYLAKVNTVVEYAADKKWVQTVARRTPGFHDPDSDS